MSDKISYTPFISKPIPESSALSPIPISFPISEYRGIDPDREVIPVQYTPPKPELKTKPEDGQSNLFKWARLTLRSTPEVIEEAKSGKTYSDKKKFKSDLKSAYEKELQARGISADYADYIVAQDALESNWGKSSLARYYNFGGVKETRKGEGVEMNTKEHDGKKMVDTKASFRKFNDLNDYVKYKLDLLGNSNYDVFSYNPDQLYTRLVTAKNKYATDPDYLDKMNKMYKSILAIS